MIDAYILLDTGFCRVSEHLTLQGGQRRKLDFHALVALLHHPCHGWIMWDTGYAPRMLAATRHLPYRLYRLATPLHIPPRASVIEQLPALSIAPQQIGTIILSHFHADHLAGLHDFPLARVIASRSAYASVRGKRGWHALRRGFLPQLLPADFEQRATLLTPDDFTSAPLPYLGATCDLYGDGSLRIVWLPGHARGQIGMLVQTAPSPVLLAADGCWLRAAYRDLRPPHPRTHLFVDDPHAVQQTLYNLHHFARAHPEVNIIPTHCPEVLAQVTRPTLQVPQ